MEDPMTRKALLFYILGVGDCDLHPGPHSVAQLALTAPTKKRPQVCTLKPPTLCTHCPLGGVNGYIPSGPMLWEQMVPCGQLAE